jgi:hypothetical protein
MLESDLEGRNAGGVLCAIEDALLTRHAKLFHATFTMLSLSS